MALKSRLLTTALIVPVLAGLALAPARGFDIRETGETPQTTPVDTTSTGADLNDDGAHELASDGAIIIDGTPQSNDEAAVLINSNAQSVIIDGDITIRDRDDDDVAVTLENAVGVKLTTDLPGGITLRIGSGADIRIDEVRGPNYDGDSDGLADENDVDEDGIIEGSAALGTFTRIGLWLDDTDNPSNALVDDIIGEAGSRIIIDGNGARGVQLDRAISGNFDFSTAIQNGQFGGILGDNSIGVDINDTIGGYYRQRGAIDVRGEGSIGIDIGATITGALMLEGGVNATGFSSYTSASPGAPSHGRDESALDTDEAAANTAERRRSGAAVNIAADVTGGLIVGGRIDRVRSDAETTALQTITDARDDDDDDATTGNDVTAQKTLPYHYDENRVLSVRLTSHGEADNTATLHIDATVGSNGGSVETLLDTTNDDGLSTTDAYRSGLQQFYFSHGFINRGTISANGLYDTFKADAVLLDSGATVNGGIFNSGSMLATAFNADATALIIDGATLNDGLRTDGSLLLNEGTISATVSTHTGADSSKTGASDTALAIDLRDMTGPATPLFVNRGIISATHNFITAATSDTAQTSVAGDNAIALDASQYNGDLNFTQQLRQNDGLLGLGAQPTVNSAANPYSGGGDLDIDRAGAENDDGNVIGDGVIDTRDVTAPSIVGDVLLNSNSNVFTVSAGTVTGDISFGGGTDSLVISNEIADDAGDADDADDDYTAPITRFTGRITNATTGTLDVTIGDRAQLHLVGQEGDVASDDDDYSAADDTEGLAFNALTLNGSGQLSMTINSDYLEDELVDVTGTMTLADDAQITPHLTGLVTGGGGSETVTLVTFGTLSKNNPIGDYLSGDTPFIYDVTLSESATAISATFETKTADELLVTNPTEAAALSAVLAHFSRDTVLENAITGITNAETFAESFEQLFPHYSDGTAQQLSALADMATGAVSQHLQLINAGGRRGGDGWLQQFGDYRKQDAGTNGQTVSGTSYGLALGYDLPISVIDALGLYLQMGFTAVNEKSSSINEVTGESITYGAYLSDTLGSLRYELNAAYGLVDLESDRLVMFNGISDRVSGSWDATSTAASARLAYPILQGEHMLRAEAGADFFRLEHDDYSESELVGRGFAMQVNGGESEKTSQYVGLRGAYRRGGGDSVAIVWEPNYYLGWRSASDFTPYSASANFVGSSEVFDLTSHIEPEDAIDVGLGIAAHNDYFAFEFNYRARIADDEETHGGGISVRLLF